MAGGEVREISDLAIAKNLIKVGYVEEVKDKSSFKAEETPAEKKTTPKKTTEKTAEAVTEKKKTAPKRKEK